MFTTASVYLPLEICFEDYFRGFGFFQGALGLDCRSGLPSRLQREFRASLLLRFGPTILALAGVFQKANNVAPYSPRGPTWGSYQTRTSGMEGG